MALTNQQAKEILETNPHRDKIRRVKNHESALRVFTEDLEGEELAMEPYWKKFLDTIQKRVVSSKFESVCNYIRYPLPIVQSTDSIIGDFNKVFDGKNKYFNVSGDRDLTRLETWIEDNKLEHWIIKNAEEVFKNKPCSFVVIDRDEKGIPYLVLIDSDRIVAAEEIKRKDGELQWIAFLHSIETLEDGSMEKRYAVYDDENYHVFILTDSGEYIPDTERTKTHEIGFCPATFFIKDCNNSKNHYRRRSAFATSVSKLEDWSLFDIFRNFTDHYAPFPVTESVVKKCGNPKCKDGFIEEDQGIIEKGPKKGLPNIKYSKCTSCDGKGGKNFIGPGTHIGIKHRPGKDQEDAAGKFRMIFPDTDALDYTPEKLDALELEIRYKTVGFNNMLTKEAVNEIQAKGSFVSMETVLLRNKAMLDKLYDFIIRTVANYFYKNIQIKIDADFGTEWYLASEEDLQTKFETAKKIGLPINEITSIYRQIIETKYANNQAKRDRELLLVDIQDYPFYSIEDMISLKDSGVLDTFAVTLKTNFYKFVKRFEKENGEITLFGEAIDYEDRVHAIKETFIAYNTEETALVESRGGNDDSNPNNLNDE